MSAGIEKFYSLPQFLAVEVTFLCQAALAIAIVRLLAYGRSGERKTSLGLLLGFLLLWWLGEMLGAVAPSAAHLRWYLLAGTVLPFMPALIFAVMPRREGAWPPSLLFPVLFSALFTAVAVADRATDLVLPHRGLFSTPAAGPLYWVLPSAATALAACRAAADLAGRRRDPFLDIGMLLAYGAFLASRLLPLPFDPFVLILPAAAAFIVLGVETPGERMLTPTMAGKVMRCLPESVLVFDGSLRLVGRTDGLPSGLLADCETLGQTLERLRSSSSRWTLDGVEERSLVDPGREAVYYEGEFSLVEPAGGGVREYRIGLGPARDTSGTHGCVLAIEDVSAHRAALREAERAYTELRAVRERLEHYAQATMPREVARDNRERAQALRERTRERLLAAASRIGELHHGALRGGAPRDRIASEADSVRACLADVRETVGRMRGLP